MIVEDFGRCSPAECLAGAAVECRCDGGKVGDALDNVLMESTIGLYKTELINRRGLWKTLADVELATAEWVDWYNTARIHRAIGGVPPAEYESMFYTQPQPQPEAAANT